MGSESPHLLNNILVYVKIAFTDQVNAGPLF